MSEFPAALPHGPVREIFPDVFLVTGGYRIGPGVTICRNMTVVRQGDELTVLNSVRLSPEGEAQLEKLGKVKHVARMSVFHGIDDPYFVQRYKATYWAPSGLSHATGLRAEQTLEPGNTPLAGTQVFRFEKGKAAEVSLLLEREGGVLLACDCYQHWTSFEHSSLLGSLVLRAMGFGPLHIGVPWTRAMGREVRHDFARLLELPFEHLVPAHGSVLRDTARKDLPRAIQKRFGA